MYFHACNEKNILVFSLIFLSIILSDSEAILINVAYIFDTCLTILAFRSTLSIYVFAIFTSCMLGLYLFKYFPFTLKILRSSANSSISYALFENTFKIRKGPSQCGDHLPSA